MIAEHDCFMTFKISEQNPPMADENYSGKFYQLKVYCSWFLFASLQVCHLESIQARGT